VKLKNYMAANHSSRGISSSAHASNQEGKIRAAHLLVKHRDSRRPASWREANITRSIEEARDQIERYRTQINNKEVSLSELATTESDCSSARKGGDLYAPRSEPLVVHQLTDMGRGFFGKGDMQKEFEEAAFALQPGEMSGVVQTASGLHLIQRSVCLHFFFRGCLTHTSAGWNRTRSF
jgi:NIMA-interacting peptidyl-prolyl cis-trans isomerase 1